MIGNVLTKFEKNLSSGLFLRGMTLIFNLILMSILILILALALALDFVFVMSLSLPLSLSLFLESKEVFKSSLRNHSKAPGNSPRSLKGSA